MRLTIRNDIAQLAKVQEAIEAFGEDHGLPRGVVFELGLAVDELVTNIVSYAYADAGAHDILLDLSLAEQTVEVVIRDDGQPFDPTSARTPDTACSLEDRCIGGLGIHLARNLVDSLEYARQGNQNVMTLRKSTATSRAGGCKNAGG